MRVIAPFSPAKINRGIAGVFGFGRLDFGGIRAVLADETFQARPRFDERAAGGKMFIARPTCGARQVIDFQKKQFRHVGGETARAVLGKAAVVKAAFAELAVEEPKPEEIVAELFAEAAFAADAVERGQHARLEELIGWDARAAGGGVEFGEERREFFQDGIHVRLDRAQRMVARHTLVQVDHRQKIRLGLNRSTHGSSDITHRKKFSFFNNLLTKNNSQVIHKITCNFFKP